MTLTLDRLITIVYSHVPNKLGGPNKQGLENIQNLNKLGVQNKLGDRNLRNGLNDYKAMERTKTGRHKVQN